MHFYDISSTPQLHLTPSSVENNLAQLGKARDSLLFHSLAHALDFIGKSSHERKIVAKQISGSDALIDKYHGAGLFQIAAWLAKKAGENGMNVSIAAEPRKGATIGILPPAVDGPVFNPAALFNEQKAQEVPTYCDLIVRYLAEEEKDVGILWKPENLNKSEAQTWSHLLAKFKEANGAELKGIEKPEEAQALWMSYAWELSIKGWGRGPSFSFNLLSGNLELKGKNITNVPSLNENKIILSGDLLKNPSEKGRYYLNGKRVVMTHGEAFNLLTKRVRELFNQPDSFSNELLSLIKNRREYVGSVMQPVFGRLMDLWPEYEKCQTIQKQAHQLAAKYLSNKSRDLETADAFYNTAINSLIEGKETAKEVFDNAIKKYEEVLHHAASKASVPLAVLLNE